MLDFLAISLGAIVGANLRYWMSRYAVRLLGPVFPYGTLPINVLGSFVIGFLYNFGQFKFPDLAYVILFLPMVLVLVLRPQGLFGRRAP